MHRAECPQTKPFFAEIASCFSLNIIDQGAFDINSDDFAMEERLGANTLIRQTFTRTPMWHMHGLFWAYSSIF
jgi:hypothetical protein